MLYTDATQNGLYMLGSEYSKYVNDKRAHGEEPVSFLKFAFGNF